MAASYTAITGLGLVYVGDWKMAPTFHSPLSLPLLTSAALCFENSDTVVRATAAAARRRPTQHILTLRVRVWRLHASTQPHSVGLRGQHGDNILHILSREQTNSNTVTFTQTLALVCHCRNDVFR